MTQRVRRKVLVISGVFPPTKVAEGDHVLHICRKLAERDFVVEVLTRQGSAEGVGQSIRVHPAMSKWDWSELPRLVRVAKQCAPDIVFLWFVGHTYDFHPMVSFVPTILKRVLPDVTVVTQITYPIGSRPWQHSVVTRVIRKAVKTVVGSADVDYEYGTLLRDSDRIIVMATSHLKVFAHILPQVTAKSVLIPPPPLLLMSPAAAEVRARGRQALGVADGDFVFAYFGRLRRGKGLETLLEAFRSVHARHSNAKLAIIGGADENWFRDDWRVEHLHELARAWGIEKAIIWTGEYPWDSDLGSTYLRAVDAAVLPFDAGVDLNNSSFAAVAAHSLPTITTRGEALEEAFLDGDNVVLCPPLDPAATAAAMERVLGDAELRQRLRSGIEALARDWFSWDVSVDRTIAAFNAEAR